ncbi:MAG: sulfide/dihydroorotate dehydrogenase-like FAD/NAD-binding protein [Deltaproteobacteria bacterium]
MGDSSRYNIVSARDLAAGITRMVVRAPDIVRQALPGQFVVVIPQEKGERIPLTIAGVSQITGDLTLVFQHVGFSTLALGRMKAGEDLYAVLGPLGKPTDTRRVGTVVAVAGGVGAAEVLGVLGAFKQAGNRVVCCVGARTREKVVLADELKGACDELLIATEDGSLGRTGLVTGLLDDVLNREPCHLVYAVGPVPMMKAAAERTRAAGIKTVVSLNPVMVDATGMCGACRCRVAGKTVFGCVDGPEFDGHAVDFDALEKRLRFFEEEERRAREAA